MAVRRGWKTAAFLAGNTLGPLAAGGLFYLLFCPETRLARAAGLPGLALPPALAFLRGQLCDVLWAYAFCFAVYAAVGSLRRAVGIALAAQLVLECAQLCPQLPGRFDPLDLVFQLLASLAAAGIIEIHRRNEHEKDQE